MPRTATHKTATVPASELHSADTIVGKTGESLYVSEVRKRAGQVTIITGGVLYTVPADRPVTVHLEHDCQCSGRGIFRGGGVVENGVYKGYEGQCFGCSGKGYMTRKDAIRNYTYWAKYARIAI